MNLQSRCIDFFRLLGTYVKVKIGNAIELCKVAFYYYIDFKYAQIDLSLLFSYFLINPFRESKNFLIQRGEEDVYSYGETPLTTIDLIANQCGISNGDVVFELGCGRGRTCFWLNYWKGCQVIGIDYVPIFIEKAQGIKEKFVRSKVSFRLEDFLQSDLKGATVIYLYGTCLTEVQIRVLIEHFQKLPIRTKIITVSYSLTEIQPESPFQVIKEFEAVFTWGKTKVYLQEIVS